MICIKGKFFSLQYKIFIFMIILILIPLLAVGLTSYLKSSEIVQSKVSQSNLNTVRQIGNNIEFIVQDVHDISLYLIQDDSLRTLLSSQDLNESTTAQIIKVQQSLMSLIASKKYIQSIYVQGVNGVRFDTSGAVNQLSKSTVSDVNRLNGASLWTTDTLISYNKRVDVFSFVRLMKDVNNLTHDLGILKINIRDDQISNIYRGILLGGSGNCLIVDGQNRIISQLNNNEKIETAMNDILDSGMRGSKDGYFERKINGLSYLVTYYNIASTDWTLINFVPLKELLKENAVIQEIMLAAIFISFILCVFFAFLFSKSVLSPLRRFKHLMNEVENENFGVSFEITSNDEIAALGRSFNKMSARLKEQRNEIYSTKIHQREAELAALQAQINPHFLYNSLDTIYWMSRMEKAFGTSRLVEALSKLFRLSLNSGSEFTTVKNEVEHLRNYIIIQEKRYEGMIDFAINAEEGLDECKVVKLVLQPMVENAIYHGIEKKGERGIITVRIFRAGENLVYEITDNGGGADENEVNELLQGTRKGNRGFGIKNVNDRIKLYYGDSYGLEFHSTPSVGTKVTITQPCIRGDV